ncbi:pyridoxal phosphate-dependent aminotransferase [Vibrio cholerae]|uniref:pyridoxal phosphate-dependent aminotransferase n=1 Tax=Vibrio cholerae TaxID=666 RepID=UPI00396785CF|nr:aminotransferase class I/II-fold pyridoxal phosphate-dependent enzyme [Vibrio cholerae]EJL6694836.1 aminotransferase class I/II-fold pyridoxal phosphate-dependent enzyme [Vibrio cholerae]
MVDNLTEVEVQGLSYKFNFADGHAYHDIPDCYSSIIPKLIDCWVDGKSTSIPDMEMLFKNKFSELIDSSTLYENSAFSVCPTASNSIDITAAWLKKENKKTALITPAFDNLYLLLKRRNVDIVAFPEQTMKSQYLLQDFMENEGIDALFLVNPNNPTGTEMTESEFETLVSICAGKNITLILDRTFRLYSSAMYDDYRILEKHNVDYVVIEDTGKTWPTQDLKISLLVYSQSINKNMRNLYEEVYLCSSNFALSLLKLFVEVTAEVGIEKSITQHVKERTIMLESALEGTPLSIVKSECGSNLPLCWVDISKTGLSDLDFCEKLKAHNIAVLPGRFFYWDNKELHTSHIRLSLMKPDQEYKNGISQLKSALKEIIN